MYWLIQAGIDCIYPPRCPFCGQVLEKWEEGLCRQCQAALPWRDEKGKSVDFCAQCLSPLRYESGVRRGLHCYKFWGGRGHAALFGHLMAQCLHDRWDQPVDGVTWVPLSKGGLRRRGYDQCQLLAQRVGELAQLAVIPTLEKIRETPKQSRIQSPSARRANVAGAYAVLRGTDVTDKRLVLVDDVATSGATLSECAACLRMAGAREVVGLTLARAGE